MEEARRWPSAIRIWRPRFRGVGGQVWNSGGTPGENNYPQPQPPVRTHAISRDASWKYDTSGALPAANWKQLAYNDTAWSDGSAGLYFASPTVYQDPPPALPGGIWSTLRWTGDTNSGVSAAKTYTHKIGLNRASAYTAINGVVFDSPGSNVRSGTNWALTGADVAFTNNGNGAGANNLPGGSGSRQLCEEFFYGASGNGGVSRLELTGLTADQGYIFTLYANGFGGARRRIMQFTPNDTGGHSWWMQTPARMGEACGEYPFQAPGSVPWLPILTVGPTALAP